MSEEFRMFFYFFEEAKEKLSPKEFVYKIGLITFVVFRVTEDEIKKIKKLWRNPWE
jgi:hypothetical protein